MNTTDDVMLEAEEKMEKSLEFVKEQFSGLRTGKASPALVENIQVHYYGAMTRLRELAGIATPEPRLLVINAYDPTALGSIEKAILAANLGVTPMNDGRVIRIPIPELNEERRIEMTKLSKRMAEEGRVAMRNVRRDSNEHVKVLEKNGKATQDERDEALKTIQKLTDDYIQKIDLAAKAKEREMMSV
jgi:ribosome recycling factor